MPLHDLKPEQYISIEALTWRQPSLDTIATEFYGREYSTLDGLYDNFKNDMYLVIDPESWASTNDDEVMAEWIEDGGESPHPATVLGDLIKKDVIPAGTYLLSVSW